MKRLILILLGLTAHQVIAQHSITYIANEGILIAYRDQKVLIDALFDNFYDDYLYPTADLVRDMNKKQAPFESVDLFLSTHAHRDHFYSQMVCEFLQAHNETLFISSQQAVDSLKLVKSIYPKISKQVKGYPKAQGWQQFEKNEIKVSSAFVRHGGRQNYGVHNFIHLVELGNKKILHIGDAEMDESHFSGLNLNGQSIDVALVPYWFLAYPPGQQIITKYIQPVRLIGIHYPKVGDPKSLAMIREKFPNAVIFMKSGEKVDL